MCMLEIIAPDSAKKAPKSLAKKNGEEEQQQQEEEEQEKNKSTKLGGRLAQPRWNSPAAVLTRRVGRTPFEQVQIVLARTRCLGVLAR